MQASTPRKRIAPSRQRHRARFAVARRHHRRRNDRSSGLCSPAHRQADHRGSRRLPAQGPAARAKRVQALDGPREVADCRRRIQRDDRCACTRTMQERAARAGEAAGAARALDLLDQITRAIGERQDLHSIFQVVIRSLEDHLPIDFGCICLYDAAEHDADGRPASARAAGAGASSWRCTEHARIADRQNGLSRCVRGQLVYEPDIAQRRAFPFPQRLARGGLRSLVVAPLLVESKRVRRADRGAPQADSFQQRRLRVPAPAERARGARRAPGAALRRAAAGLRRPAPDPADRDAAGAAARARPDGQRHRARHQQRHLAGGAVHRVAARARTRPERRARATIWTPSSAPSTTWPRPSRACASSTASASRSCARAGRAEPARRSRCSS